MSRLGEHAITLDERVKCLMDARRFREALALVREHPELVDPLLRAECLLAGGCADEALQSLRDAGDLGDQGTLLQAKCLCKLGDWESAITAYTQLLDRGDHDPELCWAIADCHAELNNAAMARRYYLMAHKQDPTSATLCYNVGNTFLDTGRPDLACDWFEKAAANGMRRSTLHHNWAIACMAMRDRRDAVEHAELAVKLSPRYFQHQRLLVSIYVETGNRRELEAYLRKHPNRKQSDVLRKLVRHFDKHDGAKRTRSPI